VRVLLDESAPRGIGKFLKDHEVSTVQEEGWGATKNGALLRMAEDAGFEVMVTADSSIKYQQNLKHRKLALVVLPTNDLAKLRAVTFLIAEMVDRAEPYSYQAMDLSAVGPRKPKPRKFQQ